MIISYILIQFSIAFCIYIWYNLIRKRGKANDNLIKNLVHKRRIRRKRNHRGRAENGYSSIKRKYRDNDFRLCMVSKMEFDEKKALKMTFKVDRETKAEFDFLSENNYRDLFDDDDVFEMMIHNLYCEYKKTKQDEEENLYFYPVKLTNDQIQILRSLIDIARDIEQHNFREWLKREDENETYDVQGHDLMIQALADLSIIFSDEYDGVRWENLKNGK